MSGSGYYTRLAAALFTAALIGFVIYQPNAGRKAADRIASVAATVEKAPLAERVCAIGDPALSGPFAPAEDVLSVSPLGGVTAPGEVLPAPYLRINMKSGETAFDRRMTTAPTLSPLSARSNATPMVAPPPSRGRCISVPAKIFRFTMTASTS